MIEIDPAVLLARARAAGLRPSEMIRAMKVDWKWYYRFKNDRHKTRAPRLDKVISLNLIIEDAEKAQETMNAA